MEPETRFDFELSHFLLCHFIKLFGALISIKGQWPKYKRTEQEQCEVGWVRRYVLVQGREYEFHGSYISINIFVLNARMLYGTTENTKRIFC